MHSSVRLDTPIEIINITSISPLISKCQIKVCWVGEDPNRNGSVITKEVAYEMANSLPGSPIVGFFNENKNDFEEHNRYIDISNGKFEIKDTTRPFGFVDLNAKVWFAKYLDDNSVEREYLVTEGYLWTEQYPECKRILEGQGNNQSMELDEKKLDAHWAKKSNYDYELFIINEAVISKLCILGEDVEPCFEGASITAPTIQFSFEDGFKEQLFSMMKELKDLINKGGAKVFTKYSVTIGDALWNALYSHVESNYANYSIESVCEEEEQKFAVLSNDGKFYRLNFSILENEEYSFSEEATELAEYVADAEPQFALEEVEEYAKKKKEENEDKSGQDNNDDSDNTEEEQDDSSDDDSSDDDEDEEKKKKKFAEEQEEVCSKCGKPAEECECDNGPAYSLEEIPEYVELTTKYSELETKYNDLVAEKEGMDAEIASLREFKATIEKKEKEDLISSFYMLSDEDKKDVIDNIDTYSLNDIEAKLSIICVRNKVSFNLDNDNKPNEPTVFNLNGNDGDDDSATPAWVKAALQVAKTMN